MHQDAAAEAALDLTGSTPDFDALLAEERECPWPVYQRMRDVQPVYHSPTQDAWVVTRHEDIVAVLLDGERFSAVNSIGIDPFARFPPEVQAVIDTGLERFPGLIEMDAPVHSRYRSLVNLMFTPRRVASLEPRVRDIVDDLIDGFGNDGRVDFLHAFAFPLPMTVICEMLGVPPEDMLRVQGLADGFRTLEAGTMWRLPIEEQVEVARSFVAFQRYAADMIEDRREHPRDDILGALLDARLDDARPLDTEELVSSVLHLLFAGTETTARLLGSMMVLLLSDRGRWQAFVGDPAQAGAVMEEALRLEPPVIYHQRTAKADVELGGLTIPAGATVQLVFASGNHDPAAFPDPEAFDTGRAGLSRHLGFGRGPLFCVGAPIARLEVRVALETLARRASGLRLVPGDVPRHEPHVMLRGLERLDLEFDPGSIAPRSIPPRDLSLRTNGAGTPTRMIPRGGVRMGYAMGPMAVDWEERYDFPGLRAKRVQRVRDELAATGVDALLVWKNENVRYLTSLRAQLLAGKESSLNGALITRDAGPILFCSSGELDKARGGMPWLAGIHPVPIMEQPELTAAFASSTLTPVLAELGLSGGTLGLDHASFSLIEAIRRELTRFELVDGDAVMQAARRIKLPEEIAVIEEACAIGDAVAKRAIDASREGRRETEIAGDAMQTLYHLGGEMAHVLTPYVASGEHMAPPHRITTDKVVRNGDLVFADIGAMWNGYFADIGRTTVVGKPRMEQKRVYTAVHESLMAGIAVMRPGRTTGDVADAIRAKVAEHDLAEHLFSLFIGHGIGIGSNEPPYIGESLPGATSAPLEPGMVFAVEPLVWIAGVPGGAGVRIEDMVLVTDGGPRVLSRVEYEDRLLL